MRYAHQFRLKSQLIFVYSSLNTSRFSFYSHVQSSFFCQSIASFSRRCGEHLGLTSWWQRPPLLTVWGLLFYFLIRDLSGRIRFVVELLTEIWSALIQYGQINFSAYPSVWGKSQSSEVINLHPCISIDRKEREIQWDGLEQRRTDRPR